MKKHIIFNDIILITPDIFDDKRGFFSEIYNKKSFEKLGINTVSYTHLTLPTKA